MLDPRRTGGQVKGGLSLDSRANGRSLSRTASRPSPSAQRLKALQTCKGQPVKLSGRTRASTFSVAYRLAALLLFTGLAGCTQAATRKGPVLSKTQVEVFTPFSITGHLVPTIRATAPVAGSCWTASIALPTRSDAWRCMTSNSIYDPCFADPRNESLVLCVPAPWTHLATAVHLSAPLTTNSPASATPGSPPWALLLGNGDRCETETGAAGTIAGMRESYGCTHGEGLDTINERNHLWTMYYATNNSSTIKSVPIAEAWY